MSRDIRTFVLTCEVCSKYKKPTRNARSHMIPYHAGAPMERVHLYFMGPLPKTKRGNEYVLMKVDQFTKWTECSPLPSQTADITAQAAINEFCARFGYPFQIFTDQGETLKALCLKLYVIYSKYTRLVQRLIDRPLMVRVQLCKLQKMVHSTRSRK